MADKRYYWLKLKEDYFNSPKIKKYCWWRYLHNYLLKNAVIKHKQ